MVAISFIQVPGFRKKYPFNFPSSDDSYKFLSGRGIPCIKL